MEETFNPTKYQDRARYYLALIDGPVTSYEMGALLKFRMGERSYKAQRILDSLWRGGEILKKKGSIGLEVWHTTEGEKMG